MYLHCMRVLLLALIVGGSVASPLQAATIVIGGSVENGNFETGGEWGGPIGWDGRYIIDRASAFEGARFLEASSVGQRFIVKSTNGLEFELSFYARAGSLPLDEITVSFTSPYTSAVPELTYHETPPPSDVWQRYTATFVFKEPWSPQEEGWYLRFDFLGDGNAVPAQIDAVTLRQVPEPGGVSALACGALLLGANGRLKRKSRRGDWHHAGFGSLN